MIAYLLLAALSCDPALTALFTPGRPIEGRYEVCTTGAPLSEVAAAADGPHYSPGTLLDPLEAFGEAGPYSRPALVRLYGGTRVLVARGWVARGRQFESVTLLSPYPDATLTHLVQGTMMIRWTVER